MPIDYTASADLMNDMAFRGRVKIACLHYAAYINDESPSVPSHPSRYRWAQNTIASPDNSVSQIMSTLIMDAAVVDQGAAITDTALQTSVETSVNKLI